MRLLTGLIIVLSFPMLEIYTLLVAFHFIGWWVLAVLLLSAAAGMMLIAEERLAFFARMLRSIQTGGSPFRALFQSGRTMVAGALLIFPGLLSDVLALWILFLPSRWFEPEKNAPEQTNIIEGEFKREPGKRISRK